MIDVGQNKFISDLFVDYYEDIVAYCTAMLSGDEEEGILCAGEVFEQAYKDVHKLMKHPNVVGWLRKTASNRIKRFTRNKSKRINTEIHITDLSERYVDSLQYIQSFDDDFRDDIDIDSLKSDILDKLTSDEQELYKLRFIDNLTFKEIAPKIGLSESATRMRAVRLELRIKEMVSELFN